MASKKKLKAKLKREKRIADELFVQVGLLSGQLHRVDEILVNAELPGPTIDAWASQVRNLLSSLVNERGIVAGQVAQAFTLQRVEAQTPRQYGDSPDGEYTLMTDEDVSAFARQPKGFA